MAELNTTTLNTRIQLKYDTLANWNQSTLVLKAGEVAIATVPTGGTAAQGTAGQLPQILIKVGDGTRTFAQLDYIQAKAADVYAWAKNETLAYNALPEQLRNEITNLQAAVGDGGSVADAIDDAIEAALGNLNVTKGTDAAKFATVVNQANGKIEVTYTDLTANDIPELAQTKITGLTDDIARIDALETRATTDEAAIAENTAKLAGITDTVVDAIDDALNTAKAYAEDEAEAAQAAAETTAAADATAKANTAEANAKSYTDGKVATINAAIDALDEEYAGKAYEGKVDTLENEVDALVGTDIDPETNLPKSVRTIAAEELAEQLIPDNAIEALDTLQEIAAWIQAHPGDVATMNASIGTNTTNIQNNATAIAAETTRATGVEGGLNTRLTAAEADIDTAEGNINTINGKLTGITTTVTDYVDDAIEDVNDAIDDVAGDLVNEVAAREAAITTVTAAIGTAKTEAINTVVGAAGDAATANTVYGAKKYADEAKAAVLGTTADAATVNTVYGAKKAAANAQAEVDALERTVATLDAAVVKTIAAEDGLTATRGTGDDINKVTIGIDEANWTFILNCGGAN